MALDNPGLQSLRGTPNFYRCMFILFLCLFVGIIIFMIGTNLCLAYHHKGIAGKLSAVNGELTTIAAGIAADNNEMGSIDAEEMALAKSEQIFNEGSDQASIWRADARWSEMGKERVHEIWNRRQNLRDHLIELRALQREKKAQLINLQAKEQQNTYLHDTLQQRRFSLYGILLLSGFGIVLFAIFWHALFQKKVNRILQSMIH